MRRVEMPTVQVPQAGRFTTEPLQVSQAHEEKEKAVKSMPMCTWGLFVPLTMYMTYKAIQWKERWDERPAKIRRQLSAYNKIKGHRRRYAAAGYALNKKGEIQHA